MTFDQNAMCYQFHSIENQKRALNSKYRMTLYIIDTYPLELCSILALLVGFLYSKIIKKSQNFFMVHFANKVITLHCTVNGGKKLPLGITTGD